MSAAATDHATWAAAVCSEPECGKYVRCCAGCGKCNEHHAGAIVDDPGPAPLAPLAGGGVIGEEPPPSAEGPGIILRALLLAAMVLCPYIAWAQPTGTGGGGLATQVSVTNTVGVIGTVGLSGTPTIQPGNTANTTPWLFSIVQGGNAATVSAAGALKVDGSAFTQPVSGTFWQATQPVSGPLTDAQLRASAVPVSGTFWQATQPVSGTFFQATQPVSAAALPLPSGASTETTLASALTAVNRIPTAPAVQPVDVGGTARAPLVTPQGASYVHVLGVAPSLLPKCNRVRQTACQ